MKKISKIFVNLIAGIMLVLSCFSLVGCADIVTLEVKLSVYDYDEEVWYDEDDITMTIDLYRHLAPTTVDTILSYVNDNYYDNLVFYTMPYAGYNAIMVGDYKMQGNTLVKLAQKPALEDAEFEHGMTKGSNLVNARGSVGLWRTWFAQDASGNQYRATNGMDTGRATWFLPTTAVTNYDGYFCVFGQMDMDDEANATALSAIEQALKNEANGEDYVVYYTDGENYTADNAVENNGLTFNYKTDDDFESAYGKTPTVKTLEDNGIFVPENDQYICYEYHTVRIAMKNGVPGAMIKSIKVK